MTFPAKTALEVLKFFLGVVGKQTHVALAKLEFKTNRLAASRKIFFMAYI
jgi:hypothetical protein